MVKMITFVLISFFCGVAVTIVAYMFLPRQYIRHIPTYLPVASTNLTTHFSLENAPSQSLSGTVTSITGNVFWQSRTANNPTIITKDQKVQQGETVQTADGTASIVFTNILTTQVEQNTQLNIIQTLPSQFVIQQTTGTAVYETANATPIAIRGLDLLLACTNAQLTITVDKQHAQVTGTISRGSVSVAYTDTNNQTQTMMVNKGNTFIFHNDTKQISVQ